MKIYKLNHWKPQFLINHCVRTLEHKKYIAVHQTYKSFYRFHSYFLVNGRKIILFLLAKWNYWKITTTLPQCIQKESNMLLIKNIYFKSIGSFRCHILWVYKDFHFIILFLWLIYYFVAKYCIPNKWTWKSKCQQGK